MIAPILLLAALAIRAQDPAPPPAPEPPAVAAAEAVPATASPVPERSSEVWALLALLTLAPIALVLLTSFTRIVIVLSFLRRAFAAPDLPPNLVLTGLALVLTFVVMAPTFLAIRRDALEPALAADAAARIPREEAVRRSVGHLREFLFRQVRAEDVAMFMEAARRPSSDAGWTREEIPTEVLVPAFVVGELRRSFLMGFALFLPFLVIDLVVASVLVSMGMFVLPPTLISLPFKVLLFVLVDGWALVVGSLLRSFA